MFQPQNYDEGLLRERLSQMDDLFPNVKNEDVAETVIGLIQGTVQLKDVKGFSDESMEAVYALAYNAVQAGAFENAEKLFRFLVLFDNSEEKHWNGLGLSMFARENYEGALRAYSMAAFFNIDDPKSLIRVAECYVALADAEAAAGVLEGAIEVAGDAPQHAGVKQHAETLLELLQDNK